MHVLLQAKTMMSSQAESAHLKSKQWTLAKRRQSWMPCTTGVDS